MRRWPLAIALACCVAGSDARAQASGSLSLVSDYYYRGVGYSKGDPVPQFNLSFDTRSGWYAGAFASMLKMSGSGRGVYAIGYAGYARRMESGGSWEAGATNHSFTTMSNLNYREVYVGLGSDRVSGRVSYSPAYMGATMRTMYSEVNGGLALSDDVGLFARIGYLRALSAVPRYTSGTRLDGRIGMSMSVDAWKLQAAWDALHAKQGVYAPSSEGIRSRSGLVLSLSRAF
ncbi:TorF family putative porin [Massilia sp. P8910]|uniref:TorF family putative porin n=1 Tax=Massilia antarctica TaxID=2765360 RepID=UPI001E30883C|nr:TorF family putative porin [Massilia antarctica]MCE3604250.1 TorF family putative porin [Massilia antarctica]